MDGALLEAPAENGTLLARTVKRDDSTPRPLQQAGDRLLQEVKVRLYFCRRTVIGLVDRAMYVVLNKKRPMRSPWIWSAT